MVGAGIFAVLAPAATAAGGALLPAIALAALLAYANATSTARLAAAMPRSGGVYLYGRERLGPWWGYAAGWCFVVGKTASCAAMALTVAAYATPDHARPVAAAVVVAVVALNTRGVTRTAQAARVLVVATVAVLVSVVAVAAAAEPAARHPVLDPTGTTPYGLLQAASLVFFAFAGYARIATLGEEVRDPQRTIPRAIRIALAVVVALYLAVAAAALAVLGPADLATTTAPLAEVARAAGAPWLEPAVRAGAAVASLGALLGLLAGVGRTVLAMARENDAPRALAAVHPVHRVPHRAEVAVGAVVVAIVLTADVRGAIGFSSFAVLLYYAVANAAALREPPAALRRPPATPGRPTPRRVLPVLGLVGCMVLAATVPPPSLLAGVAVLAAGLLVRLVRRGLAPTSGIGA